MPSHSSHPICFISKGRNFHKINNKQSVTALPPPKLRLVKNAMKRLQSLTWGRDCSIRQGNVEEPQERHGTVSILLSFLLDMFPPKLSASLSVSSLSRPLSKQWPFQQRLLRDMMFLSSELKERCRVSPP